MLLVAQSSPVAPVTPPSSARPLSGAIRLPAARALGSSTAFHRRRLPPPAALPGTEPVVRDSDGSLTNLLTLAGYAGLQAARRAQLTSFQLTPAFVYQALAWYTAAWAVLAALDRGMGASFDPVASSVGPLFLAAQSLAFFASRVTPFETAAALFGFFQVDHLPAFPFSRWVWLATLAAALYRGLPAQWLVAAFGLSSLWRGAQRLGGGGPLPVLEAACAAAAGFALRRGAAEPLALTLMAARMAASLVS